jgi:hypothetical protein
MWPLHAKGTSRGPDAVLTNVNHLRQVTGASFGTLQVRARDLPARHPSAGTTMALRRSAYPYIWVSTSRLLCPQRIELCKIDTDVGSVGCAVTGAAGR